jgi:hypothetical protein
MTVDELERTLPNGFHDAVLENIAIDYRQRRAEIAVSVEIGDEKSGEVYRRGRLVVEGLFFFSIDLPHNLIASLEGELIVDSGPGDPSTSPSQRALPTIGFTHWFFVSRWNAFIRFGGREAELVWPS